MPPHLSVLVTLTSLRLLLKSYRSCPLPLSNYQPLTPKEATEKCVHTTAHPSEELGFAHLSGNSGCTTH